MVLVEVMKDGKRVRYCGARCHRADPVGKSHCCCGGLLRGCERDGERAAEVAPEFLAIVRESVRLKPGEYVQLRLGA